MRAAPLRRQFLRYSGSLAALAAVPLLSRCGGSDELPPPVARIDSAAPALWAGVALEAVASFGQKTPPGLAPMESARIYAMAFAAAHDVLNMIDRRFAPFLVPGSASDADPDFAVGSAVHTVLRALLPSEASLLDQRRDTYFGGRPEHGRTAGINLGRAVAEAMLARRAGDGAAAAQGPYTASAEAGVYQPTIPINAAAFVRWGAVQPFTMPDITAFRAPPPYALTDSAYTQDYEEVLAFGGATSSVRTPEQAEIARFWLESTSDSWLRITRTLTEDVWPAPLRNGWDVARAHALTQLAIADAYIASLETKYFYCFWRPITAIRAADSDGNEATVADPNWMPFDPVTPPIPDYTSGHAAAAGAGEAALRSLAGDAVDLSYTSTSLPDVTRKFRSYTQIAEEIAGSRVYVGYHFRTAVVEGLRQGRAVGAHVAATQLRPA